MEENGVPVPTNVYRIYNALPEIPDDNKAGKTPQLRYYHPGVGTEGSFWSKLLGGIKGKGLNGIIMSGYRWLCDWVNSDDDRIYLIGFSRGAYTARSLAGFIRECGLLDLSVYEQKDRWIAVEKAFYYGYRRKLSPSQWKLGPAPTFKKEPKIKDAVFFVGVWDTVGALGIPDNLSVLNWFDRPSLYRFHDTGLSDTVTHARHACALDESRGSFTATVWTDQEGNTMEPSAKVKQLWFPGEHGDVGGGRKERGLADGALLWMIDEMAHLGVEFIEKMKAQIIPDPRDVAHNPLTGIYKNLAIQPRNVPCLCETNKHLFHESAFKRQNDPPIAQAPYRPYDLIEELAVKGKVTVPVYAAERWNFTGVYLDPGAYEFKATGEWLDKWFKHDPSGALTGIYSTINGWTKLRVYLDLIPGFAALFFGSVLGKVEIVYRKIINNRYASLWGCKRIEGAPWFSLIGVVANAGNPGKDGTPRPHAIFTIGKSRTVIIVTEKHAMETGKRQTFGAARFRKSHEVTVVKGGYLYAFANDAWNGYGGNRGQVKVTITRLPNR